MRHWIGTGSGVGDDRRSQRLYQRLQQGVGEGTRIELFLPVTHEPLKHREQTAPQKNKLGSGEAVHRKLQK